MRGRRVYIDTNIFIYVALKHPDYYKKCHDILEMLVSREFDGFGSYPVLFELFGTLSRFSAGAAYEAACSYLDLPITLLGMNRDTLIYAKEIAVLSGVTYDSLHAVLIAQNNIDYCGYRGYWELA